MSTSRVSAFRSSSRIEGSGVRAYWLNASTMLFSAATWLTMVRVERASISASAPESLRGELGFHALGGKLDRRERIA